MTLLFALAMSGSFGVREVLDYAVLVDSASAALLATQARYRWSVDSWAGGHRLGAQPIETG